MFRSGYRMAVRIFWATCAIACLGSFLVLFCSVQYIQDHDTGRTLYNTVALDQQEGRDVNELIRENQQLKERVEQLRLGIISAERTREQHLTGRFIKSWKEGMIKDDGMDWFNNADLSQNTYLNCSDIKNIKIIKELGRGYTKVTQHGIYNGKNVAVKSAALESIDFHKCLQQKRANNAGNCMMYSRYKVMKELLLYQQLQHPNVAKLLGYCFQNDQDTNDIRTRGLTVVTELGIPVNLMRLLQTPWHQRFRVAVGLARILQFFSSSPLGSLAIKDFQLTQFVLVEDEIKISDLDDIGNEPRVCNSFRDCLIGSYRKNTTLACQDGQCHKFNEKLNIYNLYRFYLSTFLLPGAPKHVFDDLKNIDNDTESFKFDSNELLERLENVLLKLRNGQGLNTTSQTKTKYNIIPNADFPGFHDYACSQSFSSVNCHILVFNEDIAKQKCDNDEKCKAFVLTYQKTWTGYKSVFLKNDSSHMTFSSHNMVYVKIT